MRKDEKHFKPISLLPSKQRREILTLKIMKVAVTFTSMILVVSAIFFVATPLLNLTKNQEISNIDNDINLILQEIKGMQSYEEVYNNNRTFIDVLTKAMGTEPEWDKILTFLVTSKPMTIQIQSIDQMVKSNAPSQTPNVNASAIGGGEGADLPIIINCLVTNLSDFEFWIKTLKSSNPAFAGLTVGDFVGNEEVQIGQIPITIGTDDGTTSIFRAVVPSQVTPNSGNFFIDVNSGIYGISLKASHWLRKLTADFNVDVSTIFGAVTLINGDVVESNEVDFFDINSVRAAYGSALGDENWNDRADLDGSGEVDFFDINIARSNYGQGGD